MSTTFSYGMLYLTRYEEQGLGLSWDKFWVSPLFQDDTNFGVTFFCLLANSVLYCIIAVVIVCLQSEHLEWPCRFQMASTAKLLNVLYLYILSSLFSPLFYVNLC